MTNREFAGLIIGMSKKLWGAPHIYFYQFDGGVLQQLWGAPHIYVLRLPVHMRGRATRVRDTCPRCPMTMTMTMTMTMGMINTDIITMKMAMTKKGVEPTVSRTLVLSVP